MNLKGNNGFYIDDWVVTPAEGLLTQGSKTVHLEPKAMEVLVYLASHPGEVVSRENLESDVWHGALVGYDAVTNTVIKLRKALNDDARQPRFIATIPKMGYQLIAPVSLLDKDVNPSQSAASAAEQTGNGAQAQQSRLSWRGIGMKSFVLIAIAAVTFVISTAAWLWYKSSETTGKLPSIVILPFEEHSHTPKQENLADGMTEDVITDLSQLSQLLVIARNTSFRYKGENISIKQIGKDLGVDYVLKGSIRQHNSNLRINVQLINASTGYNVWAERYDRKLTEMFSVQDEVTHNIVRALAIKLTSQEKSRISRRATASLKAYDYFQEGRQLSRVSTKQTNEQARAVFHKAIELDPAYGRVYGAMAYTLATDYQSGWTSSPQWTLDRALELAKKSVLLDSSSPQTYWSLGFVYTLRKEFKNAETAAAQSISIAPSYADGYGLLALINLHLGHPKKALQLISRGMLLNPYYTWEYLNIQGNAYYMLGNYDAAIAALEKAQSRNENAIPVKLSLAASYVNVGRLNDADWTASLTIALNPQITVTDIGKNIPITDPKIKNKFLSDLKKAGFPQ